MFRWREPHIFVTWFTKWLHDPSHRWIIGYENNPGYSISHRKYQVRRNLDQMIQVVHCNERWKLSFKLFLVVSSKETPWITLKKPIMAIRHKDKVVYLIFLELKNSSLKIPLLHHERVGFWGWDFFSKPKKLKYQTLFYVLWP